MSQFEEPTSTNEESDLSELYNNPVFQKDFLSALRMTILNKKKFPAESSGVGNLEEEVESLRKELSQIETVEGMIAFAEKEKLEITPEELENIRLVSA
jgi:hypothetical protein